MPIPWTVSLEPRRMRCLRFLALCAWLAASASCRDAGSAGNRGAPPPDTGEAPASSAAEAGPLETSAAWPAFQRAIQAKDRGDLDAAVEAFREAAAADPEQLQPTYLLGRTLCFLATERVTSGIVRYDLLEEGTTALDRATELAPENVDVRYWAAVGWQSAGQPERALAHLDEALARAPDDRRLHETRGSIHYRAGDLEAARDATRRALSLAPEAFGLCYQLGLVEAQLGEPAVAAEMFERAIALAPYRPKPYLGLGNALTELGRNAEAEAAFAQFERINGLRNELQRALKAAREAPQDAERMARLGWLQMQLGRDPAAVENLTRAHDLAPANGRALVGLARLAARRADPTAVARWLQAVDELDSAAWDEDVRTALEELRSEDRGD